MPEDQSEARALVRGAVDLYNHASPDLFVRRFNDIGMARVAQAAGLSAVVHRHHFVATDDRSRIATEETGFPVVGAIELGDAVGMNPWAVDLALQGGAAWVCLPSLSAAAFRPGLRSMIGSPHYKPAHFGPGELTCLDSTGHLLPVVETVLGQVRDAAVTLSLGYVSFDEAIASARRAAEIGITKMVVTNPRPRFSFDEIATFAEIPGLYFEVTLYMSHPAGPAGATSPAKVDNIVQAIRSVGVDRAVMSSDGGMADAPEPPVILAWGLAELSRRGFTIAELSTLVRHNPRQLVPAPPLPADPAVLCPTL